MDKTKYSYELILYDDQSKDNTPEIIRGLQKKYPQVRAFFHSMNKGRGRTVTDGISEARGKIVGFIDIDLEVPISEVLPLIIWIEKGYAVATAKRHYDFNLRFLHRYILSKGYSWLSRFILKSNLQDTETGCKFFAKEKILPVLKETKDERWFWDTEVMVRAYFHGLRIIEQDSLFVKNPNADSTVKIFSDTQKYLQALLAFRKEVEKLQREPAAK